MSIGDSALIGGSYTASVSYPGDTDLDGSGPADAPFVVSLALTAPPLPNPVFNAAYPATISTGASGTAPVSFTEVGALPTGLKLLTTGAFSGTPTNAAQIGTSFPITVTATDANNATGSQAYTLTLGSPCAAGLTTHVLTASSGSGNFVGIFCVNAAGTGTYTQGSVHGTGTVTPSAYATRVTAFGSDLSLIGQVTAPLEHLHRDGAGAGQGGDLHAVVGQVPVWSHSSETICISMSEATSSANSEQRQGCSARSASRTRETSRSTTRC